MCRVAAPSTPQHRAARGGNRTNEAAEEDIGCNNWQWGAPWARMAEEAQKYVEMAAVYLQRGNAAAARGCAWCFTRPQKIRAR